MNLAQHHRIFGRALARPRLVVVALFAVYLAVGLMSVGSYGLSWDESANRQNGIVSAIYINGVLGHALLSPHALATRTQAWRHDNFGHPDSVAPDKAIGDRALFSYVDRTYGVAFELVLVAIEAVLGLRDTRDVYVMRHVCTFLLFFVAVCFIYRLTARMCSSRRAGLLAASFLVLSPPIFAHSFYNSKDIAFLSLYLLAVVSLIGYVRHASAKTAVVHAFTCALLISVRVVGGIMPALTLVVIGVVVLASPNRRHTRVQRSMQAAVYLVAVAGLTVLFWPYLWEAPFAHLIESIRVMSRFWWDGQVLYLDHFYRAQELPWHYLPVWIAISTPVIYLAATGIGLAHTMRSVAAALRRRASAIAPIPPLSDARLIQEILCLLAGILPLALVIIQRAVVYDGWRHVFFIYPPLLILGVSGIQHLVVFLRRQDRPWTRWAVRGIKAVVACSLVWTAVEMIANHPHQQVYLNAPARWLMGDGFERDYWGLSYQDMLEWIAKTDPSLSISVATSDPFVGSFNALILPRSTRERLRFVSSAQEADYFCSNLREPEHVWAWRRGEFPYQGKAFAVSSYGREIGLVYRLR